MCNVVLNAAVEGMSVDSICADLQATAGSNTIREQLNKVLDVCELRRQEFDLNTAPMGCVPPEMPRWGGTWRRITTMSLFYG